MVFRNQAPNRLDWRTELYHQVQTKQVFQLYVDRTLNLLNYCCIEGLFDGSCNTTGFSYKNVRENKGCAVMQPEYDVVCEYHRHFSIL